MAGINETTQFIEDPEIIDLINEANSAVDKVFNFSLKLIFNFILFNFKPIPAESRHNQRGI